MKKVEKKSGKQRLKNVELGTENRKTHDVKPKTENTEHGTLLPGGSIISFRYPVSCFESCSFTSENVPENDRYINLYNI